MSIQKEVFGKIEDQEIYCYTIKNKNNITAKVITFGATLIDLSVPDFKNNIQNIVLSYGSIEEYQKQGYFGCTVGRVANRISKGQFTLNGKEYKLFINNGPNSLHGGEKGFDKKIWDSKVDNGKVVFEYKSKDGEEGYPGNLIVEASYELNDNNQLVLEYKAKSDQDTIINLTNHTFFNLLGQESEKDVLNHEIQINSDYFIPIDDYSIPLGHLEKVENTPMDFRKVQKIGEKINELKMGYDHTYVKKSDSFKDVFIEVYEPNTKRKLNVYTSEPGAQFYTGNYLNGSRVGSTGVKFEKFFGFCLECQHFPDSINQKDFPSIILKKDENYYQKTIYEFPKIEK